MKKSFILILSLLALVMASCGGRNSDEIFSTIPANTSFVSMVDVKKIHSGLEKAESVDMSSDLFKSLVSSDSQVDFSTRAAIFEFRSNAVVTFFVKDGEKFRNQLKNDASLTFEEEDDVWYSSDYSVFIKGSQAWLSPGYNGLNPENIEDFASLAEKEAFASLGCADRLASSGADVSMVYNLQSVASTRLGQSGMLQSLGLIYDNAAYLMATADFETGKITGHFTVLDKKGDNATSSIKSAEIDYSALKAFTGRGSCFVAFAIDSQLANLIVEQASRFGAIPTHIKTVLSQIDGNVILSLNPKTMNSHNVEAMLSVGFKTESAASDCAALVRSLPASELEGLDVSVSGKTLLIGSAHQVGQSIGEIADMFKGKGFGVVFDPVDAGIVSPADASQISRVCIVSASDSNSSAIDFTIDTKPGQNSLLTLLELLKK